MPQITLNTKVSLLIYLNISWGQKIAFSLMEIFSLEYIYSETIKTSLEKFWLKEQWSRWEISAQQKKNK